MAENDKDSADKDKALAEKAYEAAASSASEKAKTPVAEAKAAPIPAAAKVTEDKPEVPPVAPVVKTETAEVSKTPPAVEAKPAVPAKAAQKPSEEIPMAKVPAKSKVPAKAKLAAKPAAPKPSFAPEIKPAAKVEPVVKAEPVAKVSPVIKAEPKPAPAVPVKAVQAEPVAKIAKAAPAPAKPMAPVSKAAPKTADIKPPLFAGLFTNFLLEENTMDMSANFSGIQDAMTEAQTKAKAAFEKGTAMLGEVSDFTKGNVEAVMESGKILADGVQGLGSEIVAEGRATFETISGDIKELAAAKSPTDFFKIQGDMMRKNFDSAVAYGSKNSETMLKLMSDVMAPISGRVSLAMEKVRQTSI